MVYHWFTLGKLESFSLGRINWWSWCARQETYGQNPMKPSAFPAQKCGDKPRWCLQRVNSSTKAVCSSNLSSIHHSHLVFHHTKPFKFTWLKTNCFCLFRSGQAEDIQANYRPSMGANHWIQVVSNDGVNVQVVILSPKCSLTRISGILSVYCILNDSYQLWS